MEKDEKQEAYERYATQQADALREALGDELYELLEELTREGQGD